MTPRIIPNMPPAEYHAHPAISNSFLTAWKRNALTAIYERANPPEPTDAMVFGSQVHAALLEPDAFYSRYAVLPELNLRTNEGKAAKAAAVLKAGGEAYVMKPERMAQIGNIVSAIKAHKRAAALFEKVTQRELSVFWVDEETGIECRCRMDAIGGVILADLKTTEDASRETFEFSIYKYGYYRQAAMYLRAAKAAGIDIQHYSIVAAEKEAPHGVNVFRLTDEAIAQGDREISDLLKQVALWRETGIVPGYSETVIDVSLPERVWRSLEFEGANKSE